VVSTVPSSRNQEPYIHIVAPRFFPVGPFFSIILQNLNGFGFGGFGFGLHGVLLIETLAEI
jgi:hypothetical protein